VEWNADGMTDRANRYLGEVARQPLGLAVLRAADRPNERS